MSHSIIGKIGLLSLRSRSQWGFIKVRQFLTYICWSAEPLQQNLVWWYIIISLSVLWKDWIAVFKLKVIANDYNVIEYLSVLYFLYHWSLCNQICWYTVNKQTKCKSGCTLTVTLMTCTFCCARQKKIYTLFHGISISCIIFLFCM